MKEREREMGRDDCLAEKSGDLTLHATNYLKDGAVYDGAHCLCVLSPLVVCGAGVRWSPSR